MGKKVVADDPIMVAEHHCTNSALVCFPSKKKNKTVHWFVLWMRSTESNSDRLEID